MMSQNIIKELVHKDNSFERIPKTNPSMGVPLDWSGQFAKCPKCGRITNIRVCFGCKGLMCEECLPEHQLVCLRK